MEAKKEMKKLKALTNFLLMLTILLIASGGHHKSAKLKKYLSLKYEYRDSILYLLWCSGDVEINPGPTCSTLRMLDDSEKERNWIYDMCSMLVKLIKKKSFDKKNGGMWKEKPLRWPTDCPFYNPRNKPKGLGYSIETDKKLLECLEKYCNVEGIFKATTQFDDEQTTFKVKQYHKEIIAWKKQRSELFELYILRKELDTLIATTQFADEQTTFKVKQYQNKIIAWKKHRSELFEQYILRQELDTLIAAKGCLHKYRNDLKFNLCLFDNHTMHTEVFCNYGEDSNGCKKSYTDIVRDIATTFCRIGNRLNYLEKSPGIWKTPPKRWNPSHPYYSPCNDKKGRNTKQDNELVGNLLTYCESNNIIIPSELQPLIKPWEDKNTLEITKYYTIWSNTAIIKHSLTYLELEGLLGKIHVQESLKQIGVVIDTQCWRCPSITNSSTSDKFDKSQNSGYSDNIHSPPSSDQETNTNSIPQVASLQINSANPFMQQPNSTQINLNDTPTSPHSIVGLTDGHLCNIASEQQNQWNQSSKKRHRRNNDESCSEPKQLHVSEEDIALFLKVFPSSSENGKDLSITTPKGNSKNSNITTLLPDDLSHDLISIKSIPHHLPLEKQTDQLVINKLPDTADDKPVDSSSCKQAENANKKGETTLDQSVNQILIPFEEQDYSSVVGDSSIPNTSNTTDQQSDFSNELPVYVELYINRIENRSNATLEKDIEQFINLKEQDIDLS